MCLSHIYIYDIRWTIFFTVPSERVKCIQQLENKKVLTFFETCKIIHKQKGMAGFTCGFWSTFNRDVFGFAFYFWGYYILKDIGDKRNISSHLYILLIGGLAGKFFSY